MNGNTTLFLTFAAAMIAATPARADAGHAADEQAIQKMAADFDEAWASGDAGARARHHAADCALINPLGESARGKAAIVKLFERENQTIARGSRHHFLPATFVYRFLSPELAFIDADSELSGVRLPDGKALPTMTLHTVLVASKRDGRWEWLEARPYSFLPR